ncbi:MAG TPA: hypothetical protein ENI79_04840, partial [Rhodospirillales bacterium]|nr:hypothetical protein [Rhodospirillales bacterium]
MGEWGVAPPRVTRAAIWLIRAIIPAIIAVLFVCGDAKAQQSKSIAAVVNDEVISIFDLNERLSLVMASSDSKNDPEVRKRLAPQVLRGLIDEKLKLQEAKRINVSTEQEEIEAALRTMEKRNDLPRGGLDDFLRNAGVNKAAMISQIETEISWSKVIGYMFGSTIQITDEEIDEKLAEVKEMAGRPELQVAEILLPVNSPEDEDETQLLANRLSKQLKSGVGFQALARSFSQSSSAASGGELGWIKQGRLGAMLDAALSKLNPGESTEPIRALEGYYILLLHGRRAPQARKIKKKRTVESTTSVNLQQIFIPLPKNPAAEDVAGQMELATTMSQMATDCAEMDALGKELGSKKSGNLGNVRVSKLPQNIREVVSGLPVGKASRPFQFRQGLVVIMVCAREGGAIPPESPSEGPQKEKTAQNGRQDKVPDSEERLNIKAMLMGQRMQAAARRLLRDLRQ